MSFGNATIQRTRNFSRILEAAPLSSTSATALVSPGSIYKDVHPIFGPRSFEYCRIDQSGGMTAGQLCSSVANVTISNITSGTTTTITTSGLTANINVNGILYCTDDAGGAGAAPEGESGLIIANTATVVTIHPDDAFTAAPAANDDFIIVKPWAVDDAADTDYAWQVRGVVMAAQDQYDYGWVQFEGDHPAVDCIAAGTALVVGEGVVAGAALVTDGAGDDENLHVGVLMAPVASDQVLRKAYVRLSCGRARAVSNTTA